MARTNANYWGSTPWTKMIPDGAKHYMLPDPYSAEGIICPCGWKPDKKVKGVERLLELWLEHMREGNVR